MGKLANQVAVVTGASKASAQQLPRHWLPRAQQSW